MCGEGTKMGGGGDLDYFDSWLEAELGSKDPNKEQMGYS